MNHAAARVHPLHLPAWRARLLLIGLLLWFVGLMGRAIYLQGLNNDFLRQKGESRYARAIELPATRGMIVDRNNEPLAISTPVESVAASPSDVALTRDQETRLARLLETDVADLRRKLADDKREFVYLKRQ
ncbi:MAG TPA: penicillin-binding protein 2, partial [Burkholderiales bacterium]